jgi:hypothetical protein
MTNRRPEPLDAVALRAATALSLYITHPAPHRAPEREREALSRGMTLLRRLAVARGLSVRMVVAAAERIRLERGPLALALALSAVEDRGTPDELLADPRSHWARWREALDR